MFGFDPDIHFGLKKFQKCSFYSTNFFDLWIDKRIIIEDKHCWCAYPKIGACGSMVVVDSFRSYLFLVYCFVINGAVFSIELFHIFHVGVFYSRLYVMGFLIFEDYTVANNCLHLLHLNFGGYIVVSLAVYYMFLFLYKHNNIALLWNNNSMKNVYSLKQITSNGWALMRYLSILL